MAAAAAGAGPGPGDELVQDVIPYRRRSRLLWGTVLPFCVLYPLWLWFWGPCAWAWACGGPAEVPEAALLYLAAIAAVHLLTALAGLWSVNVHCFLYCCWVSRTPGPGGGGGGRRGCRPCSRGARVALFGLVASSSAPVFMAGKGWARVSSARERPLDGRMNGLWELRLFLGRKRPTVRVCRAQQRLEDEHNVWQGFPEALLAPLGAA